MLNLFFYCIFVLARSDYFLMKIFPFTLIFALMLIISCSNNKIDRQLEETSRIIDSLPDSALTILSKIDTTDLSSDRQKAEFILFSTKAKMSLYMDISQDSAINFAIDYFDKTGNIDNVTWAMYCKGYILYSSRNFTHSLSILLDAYEIGDNNVGSSLLGKIASLIATIFHVTFNPQIGLKYSEMAYQHFLDAGTQTQIDNALLNTACSHHSIGNHEKTEEITKNVIKSALEKGDVELRRRALSLLGNTYIHEEKYREASEVFDTMEKENIITAYDSTLYLNAYIKLGELSKAREIMRDISYSDSVPQLASAKQDYYLAIGDTMAAYKHLETIEAFESEIMANSFHDGIITSVEQFHSIQKKLRDEKLRLASLIRLIIVLSSIIIIAVISLSLRWRYKAKIRIKDAELEARLAQIQTLSESVAESKSESRKLSEELADRDSKLAPMKDDINKLFKKQWNTLNLLCNEYFEKGDSSLKNTILTEIEKEIHRISGKQGVRNIQESLDRHLDNIISRLREQLPGLDNNDVTFLSFVYAGFSPRAICLFTGYTIKYYYKKRAVLKERLLSSDAPDRLFFAEMMG